MVQISIPQDATSSLMKHVEKNMPLILSGLAVVGNVASNILFVKRAFEASAEMREMQESGIDKKEAVKKVLPKFILPSGLSLASSASTIGLGITSQNTIAGLSGAAAIISEQFGEYRAKNIELFGIENDVEIRKAIVEDKVKRTLVSDTVYVHNDVDDKGRYRYKLPDEMIFFSEWHERAARKNPSIEYYYTMTPYEVEHALKHADRTFWKHGGYLYLNELFSFLGWQELEECNMLGWDASDGIEWLDFSIEKTTVEEGQDIYFLEPLFSPEFDNNWD